MAFFDWNKAIANIPDAWRANEGRGIKIAIIDSGANLTNPTLQHLDQPGHKFHVARPDYTLANALVVGGGNDNVSDQSSFGEMHGTACLSVLAGKPESPGNGVKGVAPQAEVFIIKIMDAAAMYRKGFVLDAIELAVKLKADVITCAILPSFNGSYTDGRRDVVFKALRDSGALLVTSLENTTLATVLAKPKFPSDQPESLLTGVAQIPILNGNNSTDMLFEKIAYLVPPVKIGSFRFMSSDKFPLTTISSSLATTALAGVAALAMANAGRRLNKAEIMALLQDKFQSYTPLQMLQQTQPAYYHK
jgi:hypothetical protein